MKRIIEIVKRFINYDRVFYQGRLASLVISIFCFVMMILLIVLSILMEV